MCGNISNVCVHIIMHYEAGIKLKYPQDPNSKLQKLGSIGSLYTFMLEEILGFCFPDCLENWEQDMHKVFPTEVFNTHNYKAQAFSGIHFHGQGTWEIYLSHRKRQ